MTQTQTPYECMTEEQKKKAVENVLKNLTLPIGYVLERIEGTVFFLEVEKGKNKGKVRVLLDCRCGRSNKVAVITREQAVRYVVMKEHVQDVFPELTAVQRESMVSGMCRHCQKEFFG